MTHRLSLVLVSVLVLLIAGCKGGDTSPTPFETDLTANPTNQIPPTMTPAEPTSVVPPCDETEGQMVQAALASGIVGGEVRYRIYLPPCYATSGRRYPTIYMLHGLGEGMDDSQWDLLGLDEAETLGYQRGALPPMIIVMPNGIDANHIAPDSPLPEVVVNELIPEIDAHYCTWNERFARAIGGISRGGLWAIWIAFNNPELFGKLGGHSPVFLDPGDPSPKNPNLLVETAPQIEALDMYFDVAAADFGVDGQLQTFVEQLHARDIQPTYVVNPYGDHTNAYWENHTGDYLAFYAKGWPLSVDQFPTCAQ